MIRKATIVLGVAALAVATAGPATAATKTAAAATPAHAVHSKHVTVAHSAAASMSAKTTTAVQPFALPAGYKIVTGSFTATAGTQTRGIVTCPGTKVPAGGGGVIISSDLNANINSSFPSGQSWIVDVNNATNLETGFTVNVICIANNGDYQTVTNSATNPAGSQTELTATCPTGKVPLGGGALSDSANTAVNINSDFPQGRGWRVDMNNNMLSDTTYTVVAVCRKKPTGYSVNNSGVISNPANTETHGTEACPGTSVAIGGGELSGSASVLVNQNSSYNLSNTGWQTYENNASTTPTSLTTYAVCAGS